MSKFDGVLGLSPKRAIKAVPKVVREAVPARTPGKSADPDYRKTTVYLCKQLHQDVKIACLKADPPARSERCRRAAACCLVEESSRLDVQPSKRSDIMQSHDAGVISVASLRPPPRPKKRSARRFPGRDFLKSK